MKSLILFVFLASGTAMPLKASSDDLLTKAFQNVQQQTIPINFTLTTADGCFIMVSGTIDQSLNPSTFQGTITIGGSSANCPTGGTYTFVGMISSGTNGGSVGSSAADIKFVFSGNNICDASMVKIVGIDNITGYLDQQQNAIMYEIKKDAGCRR